jgi:hypothetical protein
MELSHVGLAGGLCFSCYVPMQRISGASIAFVKHHMPLAGQYSEGKEDWGRVGQVRSPHVCSV